MSDLASLGLVIETTSMSAAMRKVDDFVKKALTLEQAIDKIVKKNLELEKSFDSISQAAVNGSSQLVKLAGESKSTTTAMEAADRVAKRYAANLEKVATNGASAAQALKQIPGGLPGAIPGVGGAPAGGGGGTAGGLRSFITGGAGGVNAGVAMSAGPEAALAVLAGSAVIGGVKSLVEEVVGLTGKILEMNMAWDRVETTLLAATGSHARAAQEMRYVYEVADQLGVPLDMAAKSYAKLASAAGFTVEGNRAARVGFEGVETAARVLGLSASKTETVMGAMTRMLSRGYVTSMDLSRQFSTSIPGAFRVAAQAMGVTEGQLKNLLKTGNVDAIEFLTKFGEQLKVNFGGGLVDATSNIESFVNRIQNQFLLLGKAMGEGFGIKEGALEALKGAYEALKIVIKAVEDFAKSDAGLSIKAAFITVGDVVGQAAIQLAGLVKELLDSKGPLADAGQWIIAFAVTVKTTIVTLYNATAGMLHFMEATAAFGSGDMSGGAAAVAALKNNLDNTTKEFNRSADTCLDYISTLDRLKHEHEESAKAADEHRKRTHELTKEQENEMKHRDQMLAQIQREIDLRAALYKGGNYKDADDSMKNYKKFIDEGTLAYNTQTGEFEKGHGKGPGSPDVTDKQFQAAIREGQNLDFLDQMRSDAAEADKQIKTLRTDMDQLYNQLFKHAGDNVDAFGKEFQVLNSLYLVGRIDVGEYAQGLDYLSVKYTESGRAAAEHEKELEKVASKYRQREHDLQQLRHEIELLEEAYGKGMIAEKTLTDARFDMNMKTISGMKEAYSFVQGEMKKTEDAFINFAFNAKGSFRDLIISMLEDLARLVFELSVVKPMMDALKNSIGSDNSGGWIGNIVSLFTGGSGADTGPAAGSPMVAPTGSAALAASAYSQVMKSSTEETKRTPSVVSHINVQVDASGQKSPTVQGDGAAGLDHTKLADAIGQVVQQEFIKQARPGGLVWRMGGTR